MKAKRFSSIKKVFLLLLFMVIGIGSKVYATETIPNINRIVPEYEKVYQGDTQNFDIVTNGSQKVQYRVWLCNRTYGIWDDITNGYTEPMDSKKVFTIKTPSLTKGNYGMSVWVKRAGKTPKDKRGFDSFLGTSMICLQNDGQEPNIKINNINQNYNLGESLIIKNEEGKKYSYKDTIYDLLNKKYVRSANEYKDSIMWKADKEGLHLLRLKVKTIENVQVSKTSQEDKSIEKQKNTDEEKTIDEEKDINKNEDGTEDKKDIEYKEVEKITTICKLVVVGDPLKNIKPASKPKPKPTPKPTPKPVQKGPKAPAVNYVMVGNTSETQRIYIKSSPSLRSRSVGYIYGSLQAVTILKKVGNYYYIDARDYNTLKGIRGYVATYQLKKVVPNRTYSMLVDLNDEKIYIFRSNKLKKTIICSTGKNSTPTPLGTFLVGSRGTSFLTGYNNSVICHNWTRFNYNFLFHSVLYTRNGQLIESAYRKLGTKASHGCIRVPLQDAKWIYNNIPRGTVVLIKA